MGRPKKDPKELRVPVSLRVDASVKGWVDEYARVNGITAGRAVEVLLVKLTKRYTPQEAPKPQPRSR